MAFPGTTVPFNNDTEQELLAKIILQLQAGITVTPAVQMGAGAVTATTQRTVTATDSPDVVSNAAIKTAVEAVAQAGAGAVSATTQRVVAATDSPEVVSNAAIKTAVEAVNQVGAGAVSATTQRVTLASDDPGVVSLAAILSAMSPSATSGGLDTFFNAALTNTVVAVKASAGRLYGVHLYNSHTAAVFVQLFDLATGSVTLGTTTPKQSYCIPAGAVLDLPLPDPITCATAISIACTATATGSGAPGATLLANARYK